MELLWIMSLVKFMKLTVLNLTNFGPWEAGSIVKNVAKVLDR